MTEFSTPSVTTFGRKIPEEYKYCNERASIPRSYPVTDLDTGTKVFPHRVLNGLIPVTHMQFINVNEDNTSIMYRQYVTIIPLNIFEFPCDTLESP